MGTEYASAPATFSCSAAQMRFFKRIDEQPIATENLTCSIKDFPEGSMMAHAVAKLGLFPSVSQARKNGWERPITTGKFKVGKRYFEVVQ
jgi:hypothetical protein